jgi:hypothetical protein
VTPAGSLAAPADSSIAAPLRDWLLLDEVELGARVAESFAHASAS